MRAEPNGPGHEAEVLDSLARSIADGDPVDWADATPSSDALSGKLEWLRVIEAISQVHRTEPADDAGTTPTMPERPLPFDWGHLVVQEPLGAGSDCTVYRAEDTNLGCAVALKLLKIDRTQPTAVERLLREARRLAKIRHSNVLTVHGADRHDGRPGLWTELLVGRTLEEHLADQGPYGADEAAKIGIDLCRALAAVHAEGLVHRDVKTSNVMRERAGRIVLLDFSSVAEQAVPPAGPSGTPLYMDPSVLRGRDADARSDIYSLGVVLYRLVTGRYPVEASSFDDLLERHAAGPARPLLDLRPDLPEPFVRVVERALERDPDKRFASAGEMERALASLFVPDPVPRPAPRMWVRATATAALLILVAVAIKLIFFPASPALDIEASWFRSAQGHEERLFPGSRIAPGDELFVEIEPTRAVHVWVLSEDAGVPSMLLPVGEPDRGDALPGGRRQRLPGPAAWEVDDVYGTETLLVVASTRESLPGLERKLKQLRSALKPSEHESDPERGIDVVPRSTSQGPDAPGLAALEAWLAAEFGDEVRVSKIQLQKPEP